MSNDGFAALLPEFPVLDPALPGSVISWFIQPYNLDRGSEYKFVFITETSVTSLPTKNFDMKSRGQWQTWVHCTQVPEDVPNIQVVVFGRKGKSPAQKVQNLSGTPFLVGFFSFSYKSHQIVSVK